jgi:CBS domain-containing protein
MSLKTLLNATLVYCEPGTPVQEVAQILSEEDVSSVLVIEGGTPVGIITERDVVVRCVAQGLDYRDLTAEQIMTRGVETVSWNSGIYEVAATMRDAQVRRVAVVDESENAVGLLSFDDVFELLTEEMDNLRAAVQPREPRLMDQTAA